MRIIALVLSVVLWTACRGAPFECTRAGDCPPCSICVNGACVPEPGASCVDVDQDASVTRGEDANGLEDTGANDPDAAGAADGGAPDSATGADARPRWDADPGPPLAADGCPAPICYGASHEWCWDSMRPQGGHFTEIVGFAPNDVWALTEWTLLHYGGVGWTLMDDWPLQGRSHTATWTAVMSGRSTTDLWTMGEHVAVHWDGSGFVEASDPGPVARVWSSPSGIAWVANSTPPLLARYDGVTTSPTPYPAGLEVIHDLWGTADDDVFALAQRIDGDRSILHHDGSGWTTVLTQHAFGPYLRFQAGASRSRTDHWAVGMTVALRDSGAGWHDLPVTSDVLVDVALTGLDESWLVGIGGVQHGIGESFTPVLAPPEHQYTHVYGGATNDVWLAGLFGALGHWDGSRLAPYSCGVAGDVSDLWVYSATVAYAAAAYPQGLLPRAFVKEGTLWRSVELPGNVTSVEAVIGVGPRDAYFVGDHAVLHYDGETISHVPNAPTGNWHGGVALGPDEIFLVGDGSPSIGRYHLGNWGVPANLDFGALFAAYGFAPDDVWFVGEYESSGIVVHWNGSSWASDRIPGSGRLQSISADETGSLWVGGVDGLYRITRAAPGGGLFDFVQVLEVPPHVRDVVALSSEDVWLVGDFGIGHYDGFTFAAESSRTLPFSASTIAGPDESALFVGGPDGILWYRP